MRWTPDANEALSKVPFFVRKRVRRRVEEEAARSGAPEVSVEHVKACQRRFVERMGDEVRGYQVETCFGPSGCPNRAVSCDGLAAQIEARLSRRHIKAFLEERVRGPLKMHHEFRVSVSDCPNACSRPQIVDVGLIGARRPGVSPEHECARCGACVETCREGAIRLDEQGPILDAGQCLCCGQCLAVCPTGSLREQTRGYRVLVGGKLGRHPQLGSELPRIYAQEEVLGIVERCLDQYQKHCVGGERFGEILKRSGLDDLLP